MLRVSALYANSDYAQFDFEDYRHVHFPMVFELPRPFEGLRFEIDRGLTSPYGSKPLFLAAGHLNFASAERVD